METSYTNDLIVFLCAQQVFLPLILDKVLGTVASFHTIFSHRNEDVSFFGLSYI